jgi:hypothetical protein
MLPYPRFKFQETHTRGASPHHGPMGDQVVVTHRPDAQGCVSPQALDVVLSLLPFAFHPVQHIIVACPTCLECTCAHTTQQ